MHRSHGTRLRQVALALVSLNLGLALLWNAGPAAAQITGPADHISVPLLLESSTATCVAKAPNGTFVGVGPGITGNAQAVVLARESGETGSVAFGFTSIGDCAYDPESDTLYVTDNGFEAPGAATGDTLFAIPNASRSPGVQAAGLELVAAGTIPFAASVAVDSDGTVLVGDSTGTGLGSVLRIDPSTVPASSSFFIASGLDFTAGIAAHPSDGSILVAESTAAFETQIRRFDAAGVELTPFCAAGSCPSGSFDLSFDGDGGLVATGIFLGDVITYDGAGTGTPFVSGLTFASGVSVDSQTGRVDIVSGFSGTDEDRTVHRYVPIDRLAQGRGPAATECSHAFYGFTADADGRESVCQDGDPCDADGVVNDVCVFPVGFCLDVPDAANAECTPDGVSAFEIRAGRGDLDLADVATRASAALPVAGAQCFLSDGVRVPVRVRPSGKKEGKLAVKAKATRTGDGKIDKDSIKLVCTPSP